MKKTIITGMLILASLTAAVAQDGGHLTTPRLGLPLDHPAGPAAGIQRPASSVQGSPDVRQALHGVMDRQRDLRPSEIALRCEPAVVALHVSRGQQQPSEGSGFFVANGLIVTCNHVVEGASSIDVTTRDGRSLSRAAVVATQPEADLALLRVSASAPFLPLADSSSVVVGERVLALGHPLGLQFTLSDGMVSALRDTTAKGVDYIQFSAPVSNGCSGAPLLDGSGRVVGVVSLSHSGGQNLNFAVPANYVRQLVARVGDGTALNPGGQAQASRPAATDAGAHSATAQSLPNTVSLVPAVTDDVSSGSGTRTFQSGGHGFTVHCPSLWQVTADQIERGLLVRLDSPDSRVQFDFATVTASGLDLEAFAQMVNRALESSLVAGDLGNGGMPFLGQPRAPRLLRTSDLVHAGFSWRVLVHLHRGQDGVQRYLVTMLAVRGGQAYIVRYSANVDEWEKTRAMVQQLVSQVTVF